MHLSATYSLAEKQDKLVHERGYSYTITFVVELVIIR